MYYTEKTRPIFFLIKSKSLDDISIPFNTSEYRLCEQDSEDYILHAKSNCTLLHPHLFTIWKKVTFYFVIYSQNSKYSLSINGFISLVQEK